MKKAAIVRTTVPGIGHSLMPVSVENQAGDRP